MDAFKTFASSAEVRNKPHGLMDAGAENWLRGCGLVDSPDTRAISAEVRSNTKPSTGAGLCRGDRGGQQDVRKRSVR